MPVTMLHHNIGVIGKLGGWYCRYCGKLAALQTEDEGCDGPPIENPAPREKLAIEKWGEAVGLISKSKGNTMHYRNGREAKNGDKIVQLGGHYGPDGKLTTGEITAFGVLHSATPGSDHCNGNIAEIQQPNTSACLCDCLHVDDLAAILKEKGLDQRPAGK